MAIRDQVRKLRSLVEGGYPRVDEHAMKREDCLICAPLLEIADRLDELADGLALDAEHAADEVVTGPPPFVQLVRDPSSVNSGGLLALDALGDVWVLSNARWKRMDWPREGERDERASVGRDAGRHGEAARVAEEEAPRV